MKEQWYLHNAFYIMWSKLDYIYDESLMTCKVHCVQSKAFCEEGKYENANV